MVPTMSSVTSRIPVLFDGAGAGAGELTWAQLMIWQTMQQTGQSMNIGGAVPLPAGTPVEEMVHTLRFLLGRHQALRTRLQFVPGAPPRQVVSAAGEATLEVIDIDPGDDAPAAAEELRGRYASVPFDHPAEWPVRMGVIRRDGGASHLVVMYSHLAIDAFGINEIVRDLAHLHDPGTPVTGLTPLELTARQRTAAGHRQSQKSLRYWEQILRTIPAQRFGDSGDPRGPRYWELTIRSRAMHLALQSIAHRTGIGASYVVLAVFAVALARRTGHSPVVAQLVVSNRFRPGCTDSISLLVQVGLCAIDVAGRTFDEVADRAWKAATNAYLHGYFDPRDLTDLLARVSHDRGEVDVSCLFNDRRTGGTTGPVATPEQITAALPLTMTWWSRRLPVLDRRLIVSVNTAPDAVDIAIFADTHALAPPDIEALAHEMEAVSLQAAR